MMGSREGEAAEAAYKKIMASMEAFEQGIVQTWCQQVRRADTRAGGRAGSRSSQWQPSTPSPSVA
jgi:hypothetical protein